MAKISRRSFLRGMGATGAGLAAMMAGCQPKTVVVEKEVTVEVEKEKVVKETVVVEKGPVSLEDQTLRFGYGGWAQSYAEIMITNFQSRYPNVNVEIEIIAGDLIQQLFTMAAAGTTGDVQWIADAHVIPLAENEVMLDMNPLAEADAEFDSSDIYPVMKGLGEYKGGWYMMPWAADAPVMYYNKTMLEEKGLPLPDPMNGYTVQEFQEVCGAVTDEADARNISSYFLIVSFHTGSTGSDVGHQARIDADPGLRQALETRHGSNRATGRHKHNQVFPEGPEHDSFSKFHRASRTQADAMGHSIFCFEPFHHRPAFYQGFGYGVIKGDSGGHLHPLASAVIFNFTGVLLIQVVLVDADHRRNAEVAADAEHPLQVMYPGERRLGHQQRQVGPR